MPDGVRVAVLVIAGALLVAVITAVAVYVVSERKLERTFVVPDNRVAVPTDTSSIQRGQHLAGVARCAECHGPALAGMVLVDDPAVGRITAPNLTRGQGGAASTFSDADFVRALRYGVDPAGRSLLVMPSEDYSHLSDADVGAIIAYVRSLTPLDRTLRPSELRPIGRALFATGQFPRQAAEDIDANAPLPPAPSPGPTAEYGQYLAASAGCAGCHGDDLGGARTLRSPREVAYAPNITLAGIGTWSEADFLRAMRTGKRPNGTAMDTSMPWPYYAQLTDDELRALWRYLQAVPPRATGNR
jgi:mono/diheme cytochrome c family protein